MTRDLKSTLDHSEIEELVGLGIVLAHAVESGSYETGLQIANSIKTWVERNKLVDYKNETTSRYQ